MNSSPYDQDQFLEDALGDVPLGLALTDPSGRFVEANAAFCKVLARQTGELRQIGYVNVVHPEDWPAEKARLDELLTGKVSWYRLQARYLRPDGEVRFVTIKASRAGADVVRRVVDRTERRRTEAERDRFFDLAQDPIAVVGFDGYLKRVNPAFSRVLGWTEQELLARPMAELVHPEDLERVREDFFQAGGFEGSVGFETRALAKDGSYRWLYSTTTSVPSEGLLYSWSVDITERKNAEEQLRQREAQLAEAQELAHLGSWERDLATGSGSWSVELHRILGLGDEPCTPTLQELLGRVHPSDRGRVEHFTESSLKSGAPFSVDCRVVRPDGSERLVHMQGRVDADEAGKPVRIRATVQDVTEWKGAEAALRESEERFRRVFDEGPIGIVIVDSELRCIRINAAFAEMLGHPEAELTGHLLAEVTHPDDASFDAALARRAFAGEIRGWEIEKRFVHRGGTTIWARLRASVLRGTHGESHHGIILVEDISETRAAEEARRELDTLKDGFLRVVSHDLQNPLVAIAGLANLLAGAEEPAAPDQKQLLRKIAKHADRLRRMVSTFLDVDRLYQGATCALRRPTDLVDLAGHLAERVDHRGHRLCLDVSSFVAAVDPDQVEHIIENLLDNAFAHTPPGTVVWLRIKPESAGVSIVVEDAGPGVPADLKEAVFHLFQTGNAETRRTGIGLWMVAKFAELHGGRAWVEDRPGGGAVFRVFLRAGEADVEPPG